MSGLENALEMFLALVFSPIYVRVCIAGYKSDCD